MKIKCSPSSPFNLLQNVNTPFLMRSYKYSDQTQNEALKTKVKMEEKKASASRDVSIVPDITFGFVEDFIRK